jgi:hypothetical protein
MSNNDSLHGPIIARGRLKIELENANELRWIVKAWINLPRKEFTDAGNKPDSSSPTGRLL